MSVLNKTQHHEIGYINSELDLENQMLSPYNMTDEELMGRRQKKQYGNCWNQLFAGFTVTLGSISAGYVLGSVAPKIRFHYNKTGIANNEFACEAAFGFALGSVFMTIMSMQYGPRKMMITAAPLNFLAWLMIPIIDEDSYQTVIMFFCGFFSVSYMSNGSIFLIDVIHEAYFYGIFLIFYSGHGFGIMLGIIIGNSIELSYYADGVAALILSAYFICLFYCPESPVFLFECNILQAEKSMISYRGTADIQKIMRNIHKDTQARALSVSAKYMLISPAVYKASLIILGVALLDVISGYYIFLLLNLSLFLNAADGKVDVISQYEDAIIIGIAYYIIELLTIAINLRLTFGIRKPIIITSITIPIVFILQACHYYLAHYTYYIDRFKSLGIVIRILHILSFTFGNAMLLGTMLTDYLPEQVQFWVTTAVMFCKYMCLAIMIWITHVFTNLMDISYVFCMYGLLTLFGIPFVYYFVVETKGRTLQQIQLDIGANPIGTRNSFRSRYKKYLQEKWTIQTNKKAEKI